MVIPLGLQRRVEGLLQEHLDRVRLSSGKVTANSGDSEHLDQVEKENPDENADSFLDGSVMEKVLQRRSLRMRNMQRAWQVHLPCFFFSLWHQMHTSCATHPKTWLQCFVLFALSIFLFFGSSNKHVK